MTDLILKAVLGLVAAGAAWFISNLLRKWLQKLQDLKNTQEDMSAKQDAVTQNQKDNAESDKLREIDGR